MSPRQVVASVIIGLSLLIIIIRMVQKEKLDIVYCWLWLGVGLTMLGIVARYDWLVFFTELIGAVLPTTTLFLISISFILLICLQSSAALSQHRREIKRLTQELALLTEEKAVAKGNKINCLKTKDSGISR